MHLISQNDAYDLLSSSVLLLDSNVTLPKRGITYIVVLDPLVMLPQVQVCSAGSPEDVLKIALSTLDMNACEIIKGDLLGGSKVSELGTDGECVSPEDTTSSIIHNLCVASTLEQYKLGAIHTSAIPYTAGYKEGVFLYIKRTVSTLGYQPIITLVVGDKDIFTGDPGSLIMYND